MNKIKVVRYQCSHCLRKTSSMKKNIERHEPMCFKNPNRVCHCGRTVDQYEDDSTDGCKACECYLQYLYPEERLDNEGNYF